MKEPYVKKIIARYNGEGQIQETIDDVVTEFPLTLFVNGKEVVTLVCTPNDLKELGIGFLISEGFIADFSEVVSLDLQEEGFLNIRLNKEIKNTGTFLRRNIASCCGKGRAGLYFINDARQVKSIDSAKKVNLSDCLTNMKILEERSELFHLTGGVHSAGLIDGKSILFYYEDIGRHNTIDKVIGSAVINQITTFDKSLILSGRISSEIVIKAARASIPVIISKAAPTDLAVDLGEELNISIIGFTRGQKLNIYSCKERIIL
ncbi:MAG: formate dehydrogenase accessory sulfurtransferase FdhD [Peptococcaceae bacterium]|nr:formate dehydrogenase accessory sulfurtransferase FdhD [Peptococcaceae bacterium]